MSWLSAQAESLKALRKPRKSGDARGWPGYLLGGRVRTSTVVLIIAFFAASWLHQTYAPPPAPPPQVPAVVPPGFVPDPAYTWVPRTEVTPPPTTTRRTTTTTTTTPTTTETTEPSESTTSTSEPTTPSSTPPTTVVITPIPGLAPITLPAIPGLAPPPPPSTVTTPPLVSEPGAPVTSAAPEPPLR